MAVREEVAQALQQGLVDQRVDQHPRAGRAGLPRVLHDGVEHHRHGCVEVRIGKDDLGALAAQLQRHGAVALGCYLLPISTTLKVSCRVAVANARGQ